MIHMVVVGIIWKKEEKKLISAGLRKNYLCLLLEEEVAPTAIACIIIDANKSLWITLFVGPLQR